MVFVAVKDGTGDAVMVWVGGGMTVDDGDGGVAGGLEGGTEGRGVGITAGTTAGTQAVIMKTTAKRIMSDDFFLNKSFFKSPKKGSLF